MSVVISVSKTEAYAKSSTSQCTVVSQLSWKSWWSYGVKAVAPCSYMYIAYKSICFSERFRAMYYMPTLWTCEIYEQQDVSMMMTIENTLYRLTQNCKLAQACIVSLKILNLSHSYIWVQQKHHKVQIHFTANDQCRFALKRLANIHVPPTLYMKA